MPGPTDSSSPRSSLAIGGAFALLLVLGLLQLHQLRGQGEELESLRTRLTELESASPAPAPTAEPAFGRGAVVAVLQPEDLDRIAEAVAARLSPPTPERAAAETSPRPPSEEQVQLSREGSERVERSIASGTLRKDDVLALRKLRGKLDPAAFDALLQQLVLALNSQRLVPEDPLFALP